MNIRIVIFSDVTTWGVGRSIRIYLHGSLFYPGHDSRTFCLNVSKFHPNCVTKTAASLRQCQNIRSYNCLTHQHFIMLWTRCFSKTGRRSTGETGWLPAWHLASRK